MTENAANYLLSIETGIAGGSIALLQNKKIIAEMMSADQISQAEKVLPMIELLLTENCVNMTELGHIAVSAGPGSFTGIRIGYATSLGLSDSLGCRFSSHSILEAFAHSSKSVEGQIFTAVPTGRGLAAIQSYLKRGDIISASDKPRLVHIDEILTHIPLKINECIIHPDLAAFFESVSSICTGFQVVSSSASSIGILAIRKPDQLTEPILLSRK